MKAIETRGLSKSYRKLFPFKKTVALENLDLTVATGQVFGFLGLNGAGKTTTIKMLLGLSYPTSGGGTVLGRPLGDVQAKEKIGFLPEEAYFQRHLTALEFLHFCGKTLHMPPAVRKEKVEEMLALVSMSDKGNVKLQQFSKGMLQRVGVAQALLNDPDLIIFDEPLTGLDPMGRSELKEIMLGQKKKGKTVFFSSHILSDVQEICDHVGILNRGELVFQGKISDFLDIDHYEVRISDVPAKYLENLEKVSISMQKEDDEWVFHARDEEMKESIIAFLDEKNLKGARVSISYKELEPVFLEKVEQNNRERGVLV